MKINRNIFWSTLFVEELVKLGVAHVCISPGSRNTPLTYAFATNPKVKSYVHIDERVSGFFAIGLARTLLKPVVLICTSGTAVAELYPSIIESYNQRIPLIVCTADRPSEVRFLGANQTINQVNIYKNHIRKFYDLDLPSLNIEKLKTFRNQINEAVAISTCIDKGPVHFNFPFDKPFEPDAYTDSINLSGIMKSISIHPNNSMISKTGKNNQKILNEIVSQVKQAKRGILVVGPMIRDEEFVHSLIDLSKRLNFPIFADASSSIRFGEVNKKNVIVNYDTFFRSSAIRKKLKPDLILHFGRTITSKSFEDFLTTLSCNKYIINDYGDLFDPSNNATAALKISPTSFCQIVFKELSANSYSDTSLWLESLIDLDNSVNEIKEEVIHVADFPSEATIVNHLIKSLPQNSNILLGNSLPIRDFDNFVAKSEKNITVFHNRGASGIDGLISTAFGISESNNEPTFLIIGDLSFYYDLNSLILAKNLKSPLVIILINNNGGGIFELLPIAKHKSVFDKYFKVGSSISFEPIIKAFGGVYRKVKSWKDFSSAIIKASRLNKLTVLEIFTDSTKSLQLRKDFWAKTSKL